MVIKGSPWGSKTPIRSCRESVVLVDQAAEQVSSPNVSSGQASRRSNSVELATMPMRRPDQRSSVCSRPGSVTMTTVCRLYPSSTDHLGGQKHLDQLLNALDHEGWWSASES